MQRGECHLLELILDDILEDKSLLHCSSQDQTIRLLLIKICFIFPPMALSLVTEHRSITVEVVEVHTAFL